VVGRPEPLDARFAAARQGALGRVAAALPAQVAVPLAHLFHKFVR
jgi:hypothetical protein